MPPIPGDEVLPSSQEALQGDRKERLALNVYDLMSVDETVRGMLLSGKLGAEPIRISAERVDEVAVALVHCSLLDAACISDTLRSQAHRNGATFRVYLKKETVWERVPRGVSLSIVSGDRCLLNPALFSIIVAPTKVVAPDRESVIIGGGLIGRKRQSRGNRSTESR